MQLNLSNYHPLSEQMVDIICTKTQNVDRAFFRVEVAYYLCKMASNMHVSVKTATDNIMPVNAFALAFAESGYGKNYSQNIIEEQMLGGFEQHFMEVIYPETAKKSIAKKAHQIAHRVSGLNEIDVAADLEKSFSEMGEFLYGFPEGTSPALKQLCKAISYASVGAASLEMDEIGYNIGNNQEMLVTLLELYDVGKTKEKLIKDTKDTKRGKTLKGCTPSNVFAFGTPAVAFDGGRTEQIIQSLLKAGYGRRSFFAYGDMAVKHSVSTDSDAAFLQLTDTGLLTAIADINAKLTSLASMDMVGIQLYINGDAERFRLKYNQHCHERAIKISEYRPVERAEMLHRVAKVTKLAGAYAFVDNASEIEIHHLEYAIALAECSGESLKRILNQPKAHVRLAKFLCDYGSPVTEADLVEYLPFYSGSIAAKRDLITLATAYGHRNAMAIKSFEESGVTMWEGEALEPTDSDNLIISTSDQLADNYNSLTASLARFAEFCGEKDANFCNHHFKNGQVGKGNRSKATCLAGTNTVIFDVDETKLKPSVIHALFKPYNHIIYETKSSTEDAPRYRIVLVLSHLVKFDDVEYKKFCKNIAAWMPVDVELPSLQREKKYRTYAGTKVYYQDQGQNLNVMAYYPNTKEAEDNMKFNSSLLAARIRGMQKWVIHTASKGNRNNTLYAYAKFLQEHTKYTNDEITKRVKAINDKLMEPLEETELEGTILTSLKA